MFNARPQTQATPSDDIIAAAPGHSVFHFAPPAQMKPSALALAELLATQLFPVTAWVVRDGLTEPLTIAAPPLGAVSYLFSGGKIYRLGAEPRTWDKRDQFEAQLIFEWMQQRQETAPQPQAPRQLTLTPGETAVIRRTGFF